MSEPTSTERLRALLDKRGVEWAEGVARPNTTWFPDAHGINCRVRPWGDALQVMRYGLTPAQAIAATLEPTVTGETSDGYHTFNELYHHRAVLFSVIARDHPDLAWKSKLHSDGTMYDGMFIVGIETPDGQATYHYDIDPYWEMFDCKELERAPEWDGHTPEQAIARIATLGDTDATEERQRVAGTCKDVCAGVSEFTCSKCGFSCDLTSWISLFDGDEGKHRHHHHGTPNFCPNCGRRVVEVDE